jgi:hypothetical protein
VGTVMNLWIVSTTITLLAMSAIADAEAPEAQLMVPIRQLSDSFNKGDMKAAAATMASGGVTIIDEISPHVWEGSNAFNMYLKAFAAFDTFKKKGVLMREAAHMVYVLQKGMGSWMITSFAWVGAAAKPVAGAVK